MVELLIVVLLLSWSIGLPVVAIVSAARYEGHAWSRAGRSKAGTIFGICCSCGLGAIYYFASIRPAVRAAVEEDDGLRPRTTWTDEQRWL